MVPVVIVVDALAAGLERLLDLTWAPAWAGGRDPPATVPEEHEGYGEGDRNEDDHRDDGALRDAFRLALDRCPRPRRDAVDEGADVLVVGAVVVVRVPVLLLALSLGFVVAVAAVNRPDDVLPELVELRHFLTAVAALRHLQHCVAKGEQLDVLLLLLLVVVVVIVLVLAAAL